MRGAEGFRESTGWRVCSLLYPTASNQTPSLFLPLFPSLQREQSRELGISITSGRLSYTKNVFFAPPFLSSGSSRRYDLTTTSAPWAGYLCVLRFPGTGSSRGWELKGADVRGSLLRGEGTGEYLSCHVAARQLPNLFEEGHCFLFYSIYAVLKILPFSLFIKDLLIFFLQISITCL